MSECCEAERTDDSTCVDVEPRVWVWHNLCVAGISACRNFVKFVPAFPSDLECLTISFSIKGDPLNMKSTEI